MCEQFFGDLQRNPTVLVTVNLGRPHKGSNNKCPPVGASGHRVGHRVADVTGCSGAKLTEGGCHPVVAVKCAVFSLFESILCGTHWVTANRKSMIPSFFQKIIPKRSKNRKICSQLIEYK
jgi:hypothetical protein